MPAIGGPSALHSMMAQVALLIFCGVPAIGGPSALHSMMAQVALLIFCGVPAIGGSLPEFRGLAGFSHHLQTKYPVIKEQVMFMVRNLTEMRASASFGAFVLVAAAALVSEEAPAQTGTTVQILAPVSGMATDQQFQAGISEISEGYGCGRGRGLHFVVRLSAMASSDVQIGYTLSGTAGTGDYVDGTGVTRADGTLYSSQFGTNGIVRPDTDMENMDCVQNGTARGTGTLTIPMGETEGEIFIEVLDDTDATEGDETVIATLTSASGSVTIAPGQDRATGIIEDNEAQYLLIGNTYYPSRFVSRPGSYADPAPGNEGMGAAAGPEHCVDTWNPATSAFEAAPFAITFDWKAEFYEAGADSESGFAFADRNDLLQPSRNTITLPANASHVCFRVPLVDDDLVEDSEVFSVLLDNIRPAGMVNFYTDPDDDGTETGGSSAYGGRGDFPLSTAGPAVRTARSFLGKLDVVILDNDGVEFSTASLTFEEGAAATAANEYTVNLFSAPANTVTVTPMFVHPHPDDLRGYSPQALAAVPSLSHPDLTIMPAELVFTPANWETAQTFTVTSVVDSDITPDRATITHMAVGLGAADSEDEVGRVSVEITERTGQTAGVMIYGQLLDSPRSRHITRLITEYDPSPRRFRTWSVVLEAAPDAGETVQITAAFEGDRHGLNFNAPASNGGTSFFGFPRILTFDDSNWETPQEVRIDNRRTADDDSRDETVVVSHTVSSSGGTNPVYASLGTVDSVTVVIYDDETDGVSSTAFGTTVPIVEAGSGTYDVVLDTDPLGTVEITVSSGDAAVTVEKSGGTAAASTVLTFTSSDWNTAQTVTVAAVADTNDVHERVELSHAVSGYGEVTAAGTVTVQVLDDDVVGAPTILVNPSRLVVLEGGPAKPYSVVLSQAPAASAGTVTVTPTHTSPSTLTFEPASLEFDSTNWSATQTLSVSLADDYTANDAAAGNMELSISHEFAYGGTAPTGPDAYTSTSVVVVAIDDDRETRVRLALSRESERGKNSRECEVEYMGIADIDPADPGLLECEARFFNNIVSNPVPLPSVLDVTFPEDFDQFSVTAKELPEDILPDDPESEFDFGPEPLAVDLRIELKEGSTLTEFPMGGLDLCVAVPDAVVEASRERIMALLYHDGDAWTDMSTTETVDGVQESGFDENHDFGEGYAGQFCATGLTADAFRVSPFGTEVEVSPYGVGFLGQLPPLEIPEIEEEEEEIPEMAQAAAEVVLPVLASAVATNVSGAVARRLGRVVAGLPAVSGNLAGHSTLADALAANERALNEGGLSWQNLLGSSSFDLQFGEPDAASLSAAGDAGATPRSGIGVWASGDYNSVAGSDDTAGKWDGDVTSAHVGLDRRVSEELLAGLAVSWSRGSFDFDDDDTPATKTSVVSVSPYFGWTLQEDTRLWGTVGYGTGELTQEEDSRKSDIKLLTAGAGGSRRVAGDDALAFAVTGDASLGKVKVEEGGDFAAATADARRLRVAMEVSSTSVRASGDTLRYAVDLGVRHDGGDGSDTGFGAEIGGVFSFSRPSRGLTASLNSWLLLLHEEEDVRDWGVGGRIHYLARSDGRGLSFQVQPVYGGAASRRHGSLWEQGAAEVSPGVAGLRELSFLVDVDYGLPGLSGRVLSVPYGGLGLSRGSRSWRLGTRFEFDSAPEIDLQARRREREDADPENSMNLVLRMRW